ncbi:MAG: response regulator transcription factor [Myxococcales bacterium]|nr:response regulator transcription factor [Myxococcales bacterium]
MKRVLVVEDDPLNAQVITHFLRAHSYEVVVARTGAEGVEAFEQTRPDLMLVDIQLPRKNGFEVCFEVKRTEEGRRTPILLMSAVYTDKEHARRYSSELQADGYLVKPFDMHGLLTRIQTLIGRA